MAGCLVDVVERGNGWSSWCSVNGLSDVCSMPIAALQAVRDLVCLWQVHI